MMHIQLNLKMYRYSEGPWTDTSMIHDGTEVPSHRGRISVNASPQHQ